MLKSNEVIQGMEVRFVGKHGLPFAIEQAEKVLEKNKKYLVSQVFKDSWGCYIYLAGIPRKSFNSEMFEDAGMYVPEEEPAKVKEVKAPKKKK